MSEKLNKLETKAILPLLITMAIPPMVSTVIMSLYNIVDSIFVAQISQDAVTAVSLAFPLQNIIMALAMGLGISLGSCASRSLGARNQRRANDTVTHAILLVGVHYVLLAAAGLLFAKPFLHCFVPDGEVFQWSLEYAEIVIMFSFGTLLQGAVDSIFVATGRMILPMITQGIGAVINIVLDPILIFGLLGFPAMGVKGAAVATVVGQICACAIAIILYKHKVTELKINFRGFRIKWSIIKHIYTVAIPTILMLSVPSAMVAIFNGILTAYSQTAVAVFGIFYKLQTFVYMPSYGMMQAIRPIVGFNYGAGNLSRVNQTIKVSVGLIGCIMAIGTILFLAIPQQILSLFNAGADMMSIGTVALRIMCIGFVLSTVSIVLSAVFEAVGRGIDSLAVSIIRQLLLLSIFAVLFSKWFGIVGVWASIPTAEVFAAIAAILLYRRVERNFQATHPALNNQTQ